MINFQKESGKRAEYLKFITKTINRFMNLLIIPQTGHVFCKNFSTNTV